MPTSESTTSFPLALSIRLAGTTSRFQKVDMSITRFAAAALMAAVCVVTPAIHAQTVRRPMTFEDFAAVRNVGDPQVSPDGKWVLYSLRPTTVAGNGRTTFTMRAPTAGGAARQSPEGSTRAAEPRWSPEGKRVAYSANGQLGVADGCPAGLRRSR